MDGSSHIFSPRHCGEHGAERVGHGAPDRGVVSEIVNHPGAVLHEPSAQEQVGQVDVADVDQEVEDLAHEKLGKTIIILKKY